MQNAVINRPRAAIVVPARIGSERLQRKLLLSRTGKPLIAHTCEAAIAANVGPVYLATDSTEIFSALEGYDVNRILTGHFDSGTARVASILGTIDNNIDIIINLQGDEPEFDPSFFNSLIDIMPTCHIATLATRISNIGDLRSPHVVKVVCDRAGYAMYFSRSQIPWSDGQLASGLRHIGVYAFHRRILASSFNSSNDIDCERLEQLAWLYNGLKISVLAVDYAGCGIDTAADYAVFVSRYLKRKFDEVVG